jgi:hypothetical protein
MRPAADFRFFPGVAVIVALAALAGLWGRGNDLLVDPAVGRHLCSGHIMWEAEGISRLDPLSHTHGGEPWISFEWLWEMGIARVDKAGGLPGVVAVGMVLFSLIPFLFWRLLAGAGVAFPVSLVYTMGATLVFFGHSSVRPYLATYVFFLATVQIWTAGEKAGRLRWLLPVIFAAWANLHGGFAAGLLFMGMFLLGDGLDQILENGKVDGQAFVRRAGWLGLCAAATLINPHGWQLHVKIVEMVFWIRTFVFWDEFAPPNFLEPNTQTWGLMVLGALFLFFPRKNRILWKDLLPLLVFFYFALNVQRHAYLLMVVAAVPAGRILSEWIPAHWNARWSAFSAGSRWDWVWLLILLAGGAVLQGAHNPAQSLRVGAQNVTPELCDMLLGQADAFQRPLTTTWNAGALLYYGYPKIRVSFDDRTDFYGDENNRRYLSLLWLRPGWRRILEEGRYDSAILSPGDPLVQGLKMLPEWRQIYEDPLSVVFRKAETAQSNH